VSLSGVVSIATDWDHTLFLTTGGVYAAGPTSQLGAVLRCGYSNVPVQSRCPRTRRPRRIAGGGEGFVLMSDGTVWGWGVGDDSELGTGPASETR
jgi:alpha-tubulin suppressor-like RCC1 family protein